MATESSSSYRAIVDHESEPLLQQQQQQQAKPETFEDLKKHLKPLLSAFFISIVVGLNDGSLGTLIPQLKVYYGISNTTISLLFLFSACGFFLSAGLNGVIVHKIGQINALILGSAITLVAYSVLSMGFPFPVMAGTMPFIGVGIAMLNAGMNVFVAGMPLATLMLNILHALYGVGAMISPLVASFLLSRNISWKGMYIFLIVVGLVNVSLICYCFWNVKLDESEQDKSDDNAVVAVVSDRKDLIKKAIFNKVTLISAVYILVYAGDEVTLGGWGYTWLKEGRHGDSIAMANVVSGYWAGLAIGRIVLGYLSGRFGEKLMISIYTIMIIACLFVMILSSNIVLDSMALVSTGLLLGPMFPTTISLASKTLPKSYHATAIGFIAAFGAGGVALFPFLTGQIAGKFGILVMPSVCVVMSCFMMLLWAFIPSDKPFFGGCH